MERIDKYLHFLKDIHGALANESISISQYAKKWHVSSTASSVLKEQNILKKEGKNKGSKWKWVGPPPSKKMAENIIQGIKMKLDGYTEKGKLDSHDSKTDALRRYRYFLELLYEEPDHNIRKAAHKAGVDRNHLGPALKELGILVYRKGGAKKEWGGPHITYALAQALMDKMSATRKKRKKRREKEEKGIKDHLKDIKENQERIIKLLRQ